MVETSQTAGTFPDLNTEEALDEAKQKFLEDIHAPSQRHVVAYKTSRIRQALGLWGQCCRPLFHLSWPTVTFCLNINLSYGHKQGGPRRGERGQQQAKSSFRHRPTRSTTLGRC